MAAAFQAIVSNELSHGRYLGPLHQCDVEALVGPFQTSPLSIIPKLHKPSAFCLIQNFSYPYAHTSNVASINVFINSNNFLATWGTFPIFSLLLWHLPPGSQATVYNVSEAYRTIPLYPSQWPGVVVHLSNKDSFAIGTNGAFGCSSLASIYSNLEDASVDIMRASGLGPISKWVDDHIFIRIL